MPLPMVHLFIAENMCREKEMPIHPSFLLGSISPDAIHMRENTTREDKRRTHFYMQEEPSLEEAFQYKLRPFFDPFRTDGDYIWFAKGYIAHVLTDLHWIHTIYRDFKRKLNEEQIQDSRTLYYLDTDQIDFNFYHHESWRPQVWEILSKSAPVDVPNLLTADEIEKWKERTLLHWFTDRSKEPRIEPKYITEENVRRFVQDTSQRLLRLFEHNKYM